MILSFCFTISAQTEIAAEIIGEPVEGFGKVSLDNYRARLESFLVAVKADPTYEGLIELKFNKRDSRNYKITLLKNIIKFLEQKKIDKSRITIAIAESGFERTELWIVPQGIKFPISRTRDYKRVSGENYEIIKAEKFEQKINNLRFTTDPF